MDTINEKEAVNSTPEMSVRKMDSLVGNAYDLIKIATAKARALGSEYDVNEVLKICEQYKKIVQTEEELTQKFKTFVESYDDRIVEFDNVQNSNLNDMLYTPRKKLFREWQRNPGLYISRTTFMRGWRIQPYEQVRHVVHRTHMTYVFHVTGCEYFIRRPFMMPSKKVQEQEEEMELDEMDLLDSTRLQGEMAQCQAGENDEFLEAIAGMKLGEISFADMKEEVLKFNCKYDIPDRYIGFMYEIDQAFQKQMQLLKEQRIYNLHFDSFDKIFKQMEIAIISRKKNYHGAAQMFLETLKKKQCLDQRLRSVVTMMTKVEAQAMMEFWIADDTEIRRIGTSRNDWKVFLMYNLALEIIVNPEDYQIKGAKAQGDEKSEVLESIENIDKVTNVTLLHERPENTVDAHIGGDANTVTTNNDISEAAWSLKQILERNMPVASHTWSEGETGNLLSIALPLDLINTMSHIRSTLSMLGYYRFNIHITAMLNGNKFMKGIAIASIRPLIFQEDNDLYGSLNIPNFPSGFLNASVSNVLEFDVPFNNILTYIPQRAGSLADDSICAIGRFSIDVINQLDCPTGGPTGVDIKVYARFTDVELHQTVKPIKNFSYSKGFVAQAGDSPIINRTAFPMVRRNNESRMLAFNASGVPPAPSQTTGEQTTDFSLKALVGIPSLIETATWNQTNTDGDVIFSQIMGPSFVHVNRVSQHGVDGTKWYPTMLAYVARAFVYYEMDFVIKIQVATNAFMSGRLRHMFDPTWVSGDSILRNVYDAAQYNIIIQDIQEQNEMEIRIPFTSIKPMLRCDRFRTNFNIIGAEADAKSGEWHFGIFSTSVMNRLIGPPNYNKSVEVNYYVYTDNFKFSVPTPLQPLDIFRNSFQAMNIYPFVVKETAAFDFANKDLIMELYYQGQRLAKLGYLEMDPNETNWWGSNAIDGQANGDAMTWMHKAQKIELYVSLYPTSAQTMLMRSLKNWWQAPSGEAQAFERYVSTRKDGPQPILITKNRRTHKSRVMEAESKELMEVLGRFYPLINIRPKANFSEYMCITIPVMPGWSWNEQNPVGDVCAIESAMHHIEWFSKLYTYWDGTLNYLCIINDSQCKVFAVYTPQEAVGFSVRTGVDSMEVQRMLTFASDVACTNVQGGIQVAVPFHSQYNQLLIPKTNSTNDLRWQNGTLRFYIENDTPKIGDLNLTASIFISAGSDFSMNWIVPPPVLYEPTVALSGKGGEIYVVNGEEKRSIKDNVPSFEHQTISGFGKSFSIGTMGIENTLPRAQTQGISEAIESLYSGIKSINKVGEAAENIAKSVEKVQDSIDKAVSDVRDDVKNMTGSVANTSDRVGFYVEVAASTLLTGNVIRAFIQAFRKPGDAGNWIDFGLSFAALLGFSLRNVIVSCVQKVLDWFKSEAKIERAQAQALSGDILNEIENNEDTVLKSVAVLGTILYAYIFDCLPNLTNIKKIIRDLLEGEPAKAQGLNLRGAHFAFLGISALSKVFDNVTYYARKFLDWLLDRDSPEATLARRAAEIQGRVMNLIKQLDHYDNEYELLRALQDPLSHNKLYKLAEEADKLTEVYMDGEMDNRVGQILTECRRRAKELVKRLETEAPSYGWRYDPYIICIHGPSGTGKSNIMAEIIQECAQELDLSEYNQIYAKTVKDDYWSGYTGQPVVQWDEFGQNPDNDKQAVEIVELRSNLPKRLNMAALHEKGRYFTSKLIVMTTNVPYYKFTSNVREPIAYKRRRHFMLEMQHQENQDANYVQNLEEFDPTYAHVKFRETDNVTPPRDNAGFVSLAEIKERIRTKIRKWDRKQRMLNEDYMAKHGLGVLPRGVMHGVSAVRSGPNNSTIIRRDLQSAEECVVTRPPKNPIIDELLPLQNNDLLTPESLPSLISNLENSDLIQLSPREDPFTFTGIENLLVTTPPANNRIYTTKDGHPEPAEMNTRSVRDLVMVDSDINIYRVNKSALEPKPKPKDWGVCMIQGDSKPLSSDAYVSFDRPEDETAEQFLYWMKPELKITSDMTEEEIAEAEHFVSTSSGFYFSYPVTPKRIIQSMYQKVKSTVSYYYKKACTVFESIKQKVTDFIESHPKISIGIAILGTVGALAATIMLIQGSAEQEPEGEIICTSEWEVAPEHRVYDERNKQPMRVIKAENKYEVVNKVGAKIVKAEQNFKTALKKATMKDSIDIDMEDCAETEGSRDPNAMQIREKVHHNVLVIGWPEGSSKYSSMRCLHLKGRLILVPFHFFEGAKEGEFFVLLHRLNAVRVEFLEDRVSRLEGKDWCIFDCGSRLEPRKDVSSYFIKESNLPHVQKTEMLLCNVELNGTHVFTSGIAKAITQFEYQNGDSGMIYKQNGWETNLATQPGDCGAFLLALNPTINGAGKILGIHTAGYTKQNCGFGVLITYEMIQKCLKKFDMIVEGLPIPKEVNTRCQAQEMRMIPEGDYSIYGNMDNKLILAQPQQTDFRRTPFGEEMLKDIPMERKPAALHAFNNAEGERISPLRLALKKYGKETIPFKVRDLEKVKAHVVNIFKSKLKSCGTTVFSEQDAVNGIEGIDFCKKLNMKSAAGWPYQVLDKSKKGKHHMFDDEGNIVDAELRRRLDERREAAKELKRVPSIWRDCLKDELRPVEKVDKGKSRLFTIAPVDYTILNRQYFMDFVIAFYSANCEIFSAVGIDPESIDWTRVYNKMAECGTKVIAGDYGSFDGTLMAEAIDLTVDIINEWYDDAIENQNVRKTLINEIIHTMQLVDNTVYATHQGNPSGNPLTVIINTIVNYIYLCLAFLKIYPDKTLDDFAKFCRVLAYGDDVLITVMEMFEKFNQKSLTAFFAEHGIEFTNEAKSDEDVGEFRELKDVTFLKRGFRKDKQFGNSFWLPVMSDVTLNSFFYWVRRSQDQEAQLQDNMRCALKFAAFKGKNSYNIYLKKWCDCMHSVDMMPVMITFEEQVDMFHSNVGMYDPRPQVAQLIKKMKTEGKDEEVVKAIEEKQESRFGKYCRYAWNALCFGGAAYIFYNLHQAGTAASRTREKLEKTLEELEPENRNAFCIPSGEGKSTLARKYPKIFVDHDDLLLKENVSVDPQMTSAMQNSLVRMIYSVYGKPFAELNWKEQAQVNKELPHMVKNWILRQDFPPEDKRILLCHHPENTRRNVLGSYLLPKPTGIRNNYGGREMLKRVSFQVCTFDERETDMMAKIREFQPSLLA